jgi:hypothetical protein
MRVLPLLTLNLSLLPMAALADLRVEAVTLSTAGLAMIEARGPLGPAPLTLSVRRADIDDLLKSLRLSDPSGGVPRLTLPGPAALQDVFATLPFDTAALGDLHALLTAMQGAPVTADRRGITLSGHVMGVRNLPCPTDGAQGCVALALQGTDGSIRQIALDDATDLTFDDAADRDAIARGLAALRAAGRGDALAVTLSSSAPAPRDVTLGWLQPAPVWKTAWRAEDGPDGLTLTGWAILENTTGQDWDNVTLTLATGAVQALEARLYDRLPAARKLAMPVAEPAFAASPAIRQEVMFESAFDMAPVDMDDGESFSRYTLAEPVTLSAGQMISLPFLQQTLDQARLTLYRGGSYAAHPMIAVEIVNPLPLRLPEGIVTLYEAGRGHAGDGRIPELAPGAREVVEFARDTALSMREDVTQDTRTGSVTLVDGVLVAQDVLESRTTYRIEGAPDAARQLTISHPRRGDWQIGTTGGVEGLDDTRFLVDIPANAVTEFTVLESLPLSTEIGLLDLDSDAIGFWLSRASDMQVQAVLGELRRLRADEAAATREINTLSRSERDLIADQDRLVGLVVQLGDDSPANRDRRARIDTIEAEIAANRVARDAAEARRRDIRAALRALVAAQ